MLIVWQIEGGSVGPVRFGAFLLPSHNSIVSPKTHQGREGLSVTTAFTGFESRQSTGRPPNPHAVDATSFALRTLEVVMRLYSAICSAIEAWAERTRSEGLEQEFANADWAMTSGDDDE